MGHEQKEYTVRPGTVNFGREYELKMSAVLALRCIYYNADDFWIASNADGVGAFDDIIIRFHTKQSNWTYMIQLKHKETPKPITEQEFFGPKGDFSLLKYSQDMLELKQAIESGASSLVKDLGTFEQIVFVLFTNKSIDPYKFLLDHCDNKLDFLKTGGTSDTIYKFDVEKFPKRINISSENYFNNIYLLANQINARNLDEELEIEIKKIAEKLDLNEINAKSIAQCFGVFISSWATGTLGGYYCLTKHDVLLKLTELFLCMYEEDLRHKPCVYYNSETKLLWNRIIRNKTFVNIDYTERNLQFICEYLGSEVRRFGHEVVLWDTGLSAQGQALFHNDFPGFKQQMSKTISDSDKVRLLDIYKCLWAGCKLPLVLVANRQLDYLNIVNILKVTNFTFKVIVLFRNCDSNNFPHESFTTLNDLCDDSRKQLLNFDVRLQRRTGVLLGDFIDPNMYKYIKCSDIISLLADEFNIGNALPSVPEYFIERDVIKKFVKAEVVQSTNDVFIIDGKLMGNVITEEEIQQLCVNTNNPIHILCSFDDNYLQWIWTYGSTEQLDDFCVLSKSNPQFDSGITILSAVPGMGKTCFLNKIAHEIPSNVWIINIDLNSHQNYLKKNKTQNAFLHLHYFNAYLLDKSNCKTDLNLAIFSKCVNEKRVAVLLDGFDEVSTNYKSQVCEMAKTLSSEMFCLWITTRPVMKDVLEKEFKCFSHSLSPFSPINQRLFLTNYLSSLNKPMVAMQQQKFLKTYIDLLLEASYCNLREFIEIPLHIKLLADVFSDDLTSKLLNPTTISFSDSLDLLYLYDRFINKKVEVLCEKYGCIAEDMHDVFKEDQAIFALKLLFPLHGFVEKLVDKIIMRNYKGKTKKIELLQINGIMMLDENLSITCVHRIFAEYLCAEWLSNNFNNENAKIKKVALFLIRQRFNLHYDFLFNMFDLIVSKNCPIHLCFIKGRLEEARAMLMETSDHINDIDDSGRSVLHVMALCASQFPNPELGFWTESYSLLKENFKSDPILELLQLLPNIFHDQMNDVLGFTPLDYALGSRSLTVANELCKRFNFRTISIKLNLLYKSKFIMYGTYLDYNVLLDILLPYFARKDLLLKNIDSDLGINEYYKDCHYNPNSHDLMKMFVCLQMQSHFYQPSNTNETVLHYVEDFYEHDLFISAAFGSTITNITQSIVNQQDTDENSPLHYAVLHCNVETITQLLENGADINSRNAEGNTPIFLAETETVFSILLNRKPRLSVNYQGESILHHAAVMNDPTIIDALVLWDDVLLNAANKNGQIALHYAAVKSSTETVQSLINNGSDLQRQDNAGNTPLHWALTCSETNAKLLLSNNANINLANNNGQTPLHYAAHFGINIESLLNDSLINQQDWLGLTPLHVACERNNINCVQLLISNKANVNLASTKNETPLHLAAKLGFANIVVELLQNGASVNVQNCKGLTPLHLAAQKYILYENSSPTFQIFESWGRSIGKMLPMIACPPIYPQEHVATIRLLNEYGANKAITDLYGKTPADYALNTDIIDELNTTPLKSEQVNLKNIFHEVMKKIEQVCFADGSDPFKAAILKNDIDDITMYITNGFDVNAKGTSGETLLHYAAKNGTVESVAIILSHTNDINVQDDDGNTPLHNALRCNNTDIAELLIENKANVTIINKRRETLLHLLVDKSNFQLLNRNLLSQFDINNVDNEGKSALFIATSYGNTAAVDLLIKYQADINLVNNNGDTPYHIASQHGYNNILKLFKSGWYVNAQNTNGETSLHLAVRFGHLETAEYLLDNNADPNLLDKLGNTPFHLAATKGDIEILKLVQINDLNVQNANGKTGLHLCVAEGFINLVEWFLSQGVLVNIQDNNGCTPLHEAILTNMVNDGVNQIMGVFGMEDSHSQLEDIARALIFSGADVNIREFNDGESPFDCAVKAGYINIVNQMLPSVLDINQQNFAGCTPLHRAILSKHTDIAKCLLVNQADVNVPDETNITPIDYAIQQEMYDVLNLMIPTMKDINKQDSDGKTLLHYAAITGNEETVILLLQSGADTNISDVQANTPLFYGIEDNFSKLLISSNSVNRQNVKGDTPLHLCCKKGLTDLAVTLLTHNADPYILNNNNHSALLVALVKDNHNTVKAILPFINVNRQDTQGKTIVHWASLLGRIGILQLLVENDANVDIVDDSGSVALHYSTLGRCCTIDLLTETSINKQDKQGSTPLHWAVGSDTIESVEFLLKHGADSNILDNYGESPIRLAIKLDKPGVLLALLSASNPDQKDSSGCTPLHHSCVFGRDLIVSWLISNGADINVTNDQRLTPLHYAAENGYIDIARQVVSKLSLNQQAFNGRTPLHGAAQNQHTEIIKFLISNGACVNIGDNDGLTPLHVAATTNCVSTLSCLTSPININDTDNLGNTPLHVAASVGNTDVVECLKMHGADRKIVNNIKRTPLHITLLNNCNVVDLLLNVQTVNMMDVFENSPLHYAALRECHEIVCKLISVGASIQCVNVNGEVPLHLAATMGHYTLVNYLSTFDIVNTQDKSGNTPLHIASQLNHYKVVEQLRDYNVNIRNKDGDTALYLAIQNNCKTIFDILLSNTHLDTVDNYGNTALHVAAIEGFHHFISALVLKGADANVQNRDGFTPLHLAIETKHMEAVKILVQSTNLDCTNDDGDTVFNVGCKNGIEIVRLLNGVSVVNKIGYTGLHYATEENQIDVVKYLIQSCDVNAQDNNGDTPLHLAVFDGYLKIVQVLLHNCADANLSNADGNTAIHYAAAHGFNDIIVELIYHHALVNVQDCSGDTPLHLAILEGHAITAFMLVSCRADVNIQNYEGISPVHLAIACNTDTSIINSILSCKCMPNIQDFDGDTPLHFAVMNNNDSIVSRLLNIGTDLTIVNKNQETAFDLAAKFGNIKILSLFEAKM